jgi:hypothetical protein
VTPIFALFRFTLRQTLLQRRLLLVILLLAFPAGISLLVRTFAEDPNNYWEAYQIPMQFMLFNLVLPLVCMLYGASLIGSEVEERTFIYLSTRRMHRATILLVRYAATACVLMVLFAMGGLALHLAATYNLDLAPIQEQAKFFDPVRDWSPAAELPANLGVLALGAASFLAIFSLIGMATARPMAVSVGYFVLLELTIGNLPLGLRVYTLTHQLRLVLVKAVPSLKPLYEMPRELEEKIFAEDTSGLLRVGIIMFVCLLIGSLLVTYRELVPDKVAKE